MRDYTFLPDAMEVLNYKKFKVTHEMLASSGSRLANHIIDTAIFYMIFAFLGLVFSLILGFIGTDSMLEWMDNMPPGINLLLTYGTYFLYYIILESLVGKTIAKTITRTTVVLENGEKPHYKSIIIRTISRFVPFDAFTYLGTPSRGWHDRWSKTYVVKDAELKQQKRLFQQYKELGEGSVT